MIILHVYACVACVKILCPSKSRKFPLRKVSEPTGNRTGHPQHGYAEYPHFYSWGYKGPTKCSATAAQIPTALYDSGLRYGGIVFTVFSEHLSLGGRTLIKLYQYVIV